MPATNKKGIEIFTKEDMKTKTLFIRVVVKQELLKQQKMISVKSRQRWRLKVELKDKTFDEDIIYETKKPFIFDDRGLIVGIRKKCVCENAYYKLELVLSKRLCMKSSMHKYNERKIREWSKYSSITPAKKVCKKISTSKYRNYTGNNAGRPYQGGSVTPK